MNSHATGLTAEPTDVPTIAWRLAISATVLAIGVTGALLELGNKALLEWFCREDGLLENLTALFYLLAAGMFVYANRRDRFRNIWLWGYALLFFLVAGEEISWGQRLFSIDTPEGPVHGSYHYVGEEEPALGRYPCLYHPDRPESFRLYLGDI